MPKITTRSEFAALIEDAINSCPKTQSDIAAAIGYVNANIITFFKRGNTRVPLEKVVPLARVLDLDPGLLMRKWLEAYMPEAASDIEEHLGMALSSVEKGWVKNLRATFGTVPTFDARWTDGIKDLVAHT